MGIKVRHNGQWVEMGFAGAPGGEAIGSIIAWGGSTANIPSNFRLCDGQPLSRTDYPDLFTALGTIHGSGDGVNTFNVPNLVDKFVVGVPYSGDTTYPGLTPGATGGSANAVLISHTHTQVGGGTDDDGGPYVPGSTSGGTLFNISSSGLDVNGNPTSSQTGTNANLPPYYALCYICLLYTSPSPRDAHESRMPSSA